MTVWNGRTPDRRRERRGPAARGRPSASRRLLAAGPLAACLLVVLASCDGSRGERLDPAGLEVVADLLAEMPVADSTAEPGYLDFDHPPGSWPGVLDSSGFAGRPSADGRRWNDGGESMLEVFIAEPRPLRLTFAARPFVDPASPPQEVEVRLGRREVGRVRLGDQGGVYAVDLPAAAMSAGRNRLSFRYARLTRPSDRGASGDRRLLAVSWDWLHLGDPGTEAGGPPNADDGRQQVRSTRDQLYLPYGQRLDFHLGLPAGAALAFDALTARGAAGRLVVEVATDGDGEWSAGRLEPEARPAAWALGLEASAGEAVRPVRLGLTAVPAQHPAAKAAGLVLSRPRVSAPPAAAARARAFGAPPAAADAGERPVRRRNVVVYLVDTLRADRLGVYGHDRDTSPRLDSFAAGATVFETTIANSPWTRPSVVSVFTGLSPEVHGVVKPNDGLSPQALTLAEVLSAAGWQTAGLVANPNVAPRFRLGQGFDRYELLGDLSNRADDVVDWAEAWLDGDRNPDRPFFLYLQPVDPHAPYTPTEEMRRRFAPEAPRGGFGSRPHLKLLREEEAVRDEVIGHLLDLYDAEVAAADAAFGRLLDLLGERGLLDDTVVVFTADHGEEFLEHGSLEHAGPMYSEVIEVPLVVRFPGVGAGRRVAAPAQLADVMPTLLGHLGLAVPPGLEGRDLTPWLVGEAPGVDDPAAAYDIHAHVDRRGFRGRLLARGRWRLQQLEAPRAAVELFDTVADPGELDDLDGELPVRAGHLRSRIHLHEEGAGSGSLTPSKESLNDELRRRLEALGYL